MLKHLQGVIVAIQMQQGDGFRLLCVHVGF